MSNNDIDTQVRGGVYLCQVGNCVSCGGCCGLYNIGGLTRGRLQSFLEQRTDAFAAVPRTIGAIEAFEQERMTLEGRDYPIAEFRHCVFVGLIRDGGERVGCLLHPLALGNNGVDWRGMSHYGGAACKHFFCPTYDQLAPRFKRLAREVLQDWYEYGLIIPEHRFLAAVLEAVEARLGRTLTPETLHGDACSALRELLHLRLNWPFRHEDTPLARNFFSTRQTERPPMPEDAGQDDPRLRAILRELDTRPETAPEAAALLEEALERAVRTLAK